MEYRKLGDSDITVSEIAFGSWITTGLTVEKNKSIACIHRALDLGITLIDTANVYGYGVAETVVGEALSGLPRDSYVIATKVWYPMSGTDGGLSRAEIHKQIDASLARLKVSHVDLYQCHQYDPSTPLEETMRALTEVVRAGKVRYIGFSNWRPSEIKAALAIPGVAKFVSSQPQYSLLYRFPEKQVIPLCARNGISQIVYSPLAQGVLTGKYLPDAPVPKDSRAGGQGISGAQRQQWMTSEVLAAVQALKPLAAQVDLTLAQFALAWTLRGTNVASAIIGASSPAQVDENVAGIGRHVPESLFDEAERILRTVDTVGTRERVKNVITATPGMYALASYIRKALKKDPFAANRARALRENV